MNERAVAPSPALFAEAVNAYQRTAAIKAAIHLEVFTAIAEGNTTHYDLAMRCRTSERGMSILLDYLVILGFLLKHGEQYALTPDAALFLDKHQPSYVGGALEFLPTTEIAATRNNTGKVAWENPVCENFVRAMLPLLLLPAQGIAKLVAVEQTRPVKVLDIAAGHGIFGIAFAQQYPNVEVTALDWPKVLDVARANAQRFGVNERFATLAGSAFELDWGGGYDVVLVTNFLHHFDPPTCERLLRKVHASLNPGGRAVTLEFVPNEAPVKPPPAASALMKLDAMPDDTYTAVGYNRMFRNAGFAYTDLFPVPQTLEHVLVSVKG